MNSEARITVDVVWSAPDTNLARGTMLADAERSVSQAPGVVSIQTFLISEHLAVIRIESDTAHEQLAQEISSAFGPELMLQQLVNEKDKETRYKVIPRPLEPSSESARPAPPPTARRLPARLAHVRRPDARGRRFVRLPAVLRHPAHLWSSRGQLAYSVGDDHLQLRPEPDVDPRPGRARGGGGHRHHVRAAGDPRGRRHPSDPRDPPLRETGM